MNKPVVFLGHGGHARVLLETLRCLHWPVAGILTPELACGELWQGLPVLGDDRWLERREAHGYAFALGMGLVPQRPFLRMDLYRRLRQSGLDVPALIHPSAILAQDVRIGSGAQIMAGVVVQPGSVIGENALLNTGVRIDHDCQIAAHAHLAPGAILCGGVKVGEGAFIGAGAVLIPEVHIGEHAQVAAGATVIRHIPPKVRHIPGHPDKLL